MLAVRAAYQLSALVQPVGVLMAVRWLWSRFPMSEVVRGWPQVIRRIAGEVIHIAFIVASTVARIRRTASLVRNCFFSIEPSSL